MVLRRWGATVGDGNHGGRLGDAGDDEGALRARCLRDTLRCYAESFDSAASAGVTMGVHDQTVSNRLPAIEERLEHPIPTRRAELETALRLHDALGDG